MKRWLFLIHRWLGIALGLFFLLWFFSGLVMIFSGSTAVTRNERLSHAQPIENAAGWLSLEEAWRLGATPRPVEARLSLVDGTPVWQVEDEQGRRHALSALDGTVLAVSAEVALRIARQWGGSKTSPRFIETFERDLGTRMKMLDPYRPFHKVGLGDEAGTQLDVSSRTGDVVNATTRLQRVLAYSGEWLHYLRFMDSMGFSDGQRRFVLTWVSLIACFAALTGLAVGWLRWRPGWWGARSYGNGRAHPYGERYRRWHFWLGLVGGVMILAWIASGFFVNNPWGMFSNAMFGREQAMRFQDGPLPADIAALRPASLLPENPGVVELGMRKVGSQHFILAYDGSGAQRPVKGAHAETLHEKTLLAAVRRMFPGAAIKSSELISEYDAYYYSNHRRPIAERPLPVWRVDLDDEAAHGVYVDPVDGRLLMKLDSSRRAYRWLFYALHNWDLGAFHSRPFWDVWMTAWSLLGLAFSVTSIIIGGRRLKVKVADKPGSRVEAASASPSSPCSPSRSG